MVSSFWNIVLFMLAVIGAIALVGFVGLSIMHGTMMGGVTPGMMGRMMGGGLLTALLLLAVIAAVTVFIVFLLRKCS
jgi:hypothetical protein